MLKPESLLVAYATSVENGLARINGSAVFGLSAELKLAVNLWSSSNFAMLTKQMPE